MADRSFGISTRLFRDTPLSRDHLVDIAAHRFDVVELYAARQHFDCGNAETLSQLAEWMSDTRLQLFSVHASETSLDHLQQLIDLSNHVPYSVLVIHRQATNTDRTLHAVIERASGAGIKVAVEARGDRDSSVDALVALLENVESDPLEAGICFDFGHANRAGDVGEALEAASGHILTTHVHDNRGRQDDRLVPYAGRVPWDEAMMEIQKIGYDGPLIFEYGPAGDPVDTLARTMRARERLERAFITF